MVYQTGYSSNLGVFSQWATAKAYLCERDAVLSRLFDLEPQPPQQLLGVFEGLLRAIVSQQISNKAAHRLWEKLRSHQIELTVGAFPMRERGVKPTIREAD